MGALVGLAFGLGVGLVLWSRVDPRPVRRPGQLVTLRLRADASVAAAGVPGLTVGRLAAGSLVTAAVVWVVTLGGCRSPTVAASFAVLAGSLPVTCVRARGARRAEASAAAWPDVVDDLVSAVRAGLALPEALAQLAVRGPAVLRPAFAEFAADYRARGRFLDSLDVLKARLSDPVGDRVVEALRVAREVGGSDLGLLLRTSSDLLRTDLRTRGELRSRQAWTVNGARLAVAAPWLVLALLATRPQAVAAYDTTAGAVVLVVGGLVSYAAYRAMLRIGRLPRERRVLG